MCWGVDRAVVPTCKSQLIGRNQEMAAQQATLFAASLLEHSLLFAVCYGGAATLALHNMSPLRVFRYGKLAPPWSVIRHEVFYCACSITVVSLYDAAIRWDVETHAGWTRVDPKFAFASTPSMALWIVCAALLAEAHFFWTHRLMHWSPWLYLNVHKVHHASQYVPARASKSLPTPPC